MKKQVLARWFWCLLDYLMICPIIYIISGFSLPQAVVVPNIIVLPLHILAAIFMTSLLKKFSNFLAALIGIAYTVGISWLWITFFQIDTTGGKVITVIGTGLSFLYGILVSTTGSIRGTFYYGMGLIFHAISIYLTSRAPALMPFQSVALVMVILYILAGLPIANQRFLVQETQEKSSLKIIPGTVLRGNRIILVMLMVAIILLSFWKTFLDLIASAAGKIAELFGKLMMWISTLNEGSEISGGENQELESLTGQSSPIVTLVLDILAYLAVLVIAFFILRYLVKNFKRIFSSFLYHLSTLLSRFRRWSSTEQGYSDKQESLLKTEPRRRTSFLSRLFIREPRWRDMKDNISRVRFLYTRFVLDSIRRGFNFIPSETPDETIRRIQSGERGDKCDHDTLRNAYHQARYAAVEIDDETVKVLKDAYQ